MTYKCLKELAPEYLSAFFSKLSDFYARVIRNNGSDLRTPQTRTSMGQKSLAYRAAKVWNDLDSETKFAPSNHCFKSRLKTYKDLLREKRVVEEANGENGSPSSVILKFCLGNFTYHLPSMK